MPILLSTAYWPSLAYLKQVVKADAVVIEQHEHYSKQTYRNRCAILSANGRLRLSIPIQKKSGTKQAIRDVEICYREKWQHQHWKAIESAYKNSPYFEFFEADIKPFYQSDFQFLLTYNTQQLDLLLKLLRLQKTVTFTETYQAQTEPTNVDLRSLVTTETVTEEWLLKPYQQTFSDKLNFVAGLSSLDALFNVGLGVKPLIDA